ncbi:MAG: isoprenoid biosynthesis glyoxalase ElbB [Bacteroidales bacterium]|nr:isoprenoid biosynthesis glyoxalase ElbB [Bacteroidales bacterium]MDD3664709.1 isoprenoid biosynthesis glyoxalase ElbB [Bacteroidales bacterium]
MKKIAVVVAGCGVYDGAEIHETVLTMLAISRMGAKYQLFAPDVEQAHVVNHITGQPTTEIRNVLVESARIARGDIKPVSELIVSDFDALILPGGFGVAKNLCNYAFKGSECQTLPEVAKAIKAMHEASKPIGAMCIAPVVLANVLASVQVTIGNDPSTSQHLAELGATHIETAATQIVADKANKVFTTPCYMLNSSIAEIADGCQNLVDAILECR